MGKLIVDVKYWVDGQTLEPGMTIRRLDPVDKNWYEGKLQWLHSNYGEPNQVSGLALVVEGYAPSPLQSEDLIEIVSNAELYNREMDERNRIAYESREKPWLPGWEDE